MNYGIDIDDTISKTADKFIEYGREFNKQVLKRGYNDKLSEIPDHFYLKYIFGWNQDEQRKFLEEYGYYKKMIENVEVKDDVKNTLTTIKNNGNNIYLITARFKTDKFSAYDLTKIWLEKNEIPFDELIIDADDKAKICRSKKIDIFIDDSYKNCIQVANEGIKTYLMTTELNKNIDSGNIQRVYSWRDIKV